MPIRRPPAFLTTFASIALLAALPCSAADESVDFSRDVRPILSENCFQCHGPDAAQRKADLRLDEQQGAWADLGGYAAVAPGEPEQSELLTRVTADDADLRMPPESTGKRLSSEQVELLRRWIEQGGQYSGHWSFEPITSPPLPEVADLRWPVNGLDYFVLHRLERAGVGPSPPAARATLIRRVHLDLSGLPPTVADVEAFESDPRPDAYERMVDRVLASPFLGERWGRHWLDQARYADSHGYTNDNARIMWPYRDWVIHAVNRDLPFDRFTTEQLAGDLLEDPTLDQLVATGFHRNTLINSEGGTKPDQFRDEQVKDRVDTTGVVWLGLTVGCAKCHSHKYDPISQQEYYQLYAFFNTTADRNSVAPTVKVATAAQTRRLAEIDGRVAELSKALEGDSQQEQRQRQWERRLLQGDAVAAAAPGDTAAPQWTLLEMSGKSQSDATTFTELDDQSLLVAGVNQPSDEYLVTALPPLTTIRSVRLEVLPHEDLPAGGPGRADDGRFRLSEIWFRTGDGQELRFSQAFASNSAKGRDVGQAIDSNTTTGWEVGSDGRPQTAYLVLPRPLSLEMDNALTFTMQFESAEEAQNLGRFRLAVSSEQWLDVPTVQELAQLAAVPREQRTKQQNDRLRDGFLRQDSQTRDLYREQLDLQREHERILNSLAEAMICREMDEPPTTHVQTRGNFLSPAEPVSPSVPAVLPALAGRQDTRLDLAQWLMRSDHPLTARVRVNRVWMRLFGRGLVETENDFGIQGTPPTHPRLLDYLAREHVRQQWSTKQLLRTVVLSATYRQASRRREDLQAVDPRNLLLGRQARLRVEAEIVRDLGLAVSGLLQPMIGGPSVHPPQPEGVYAFTQREKNWQTSPGADQYRRGLYTFFYRSAPYPMLSTFDVPKFNTTCTRRDRSNTPLQSLSIANSAPMFEMAQHLARRVLCAEAGDDADRVERAFRICLARQPAAAERDRLLEYLRQCRDRFQADDEAQAEQQAWTAVSRVLINLDEFITRE